VRNFVLLLLYARGKKSAMACDLISTVMNPPLRSTIPLTTVTTLIYIALVPELLLSMPHFFVVESIRMALPFVLPLKGLYDRGLPWDIEDTMVRVRFPRPSTRMPWPFRTGRFHWLRGLSSNLEAFEQFVHSFDFTTRHRSILFSGDTVPKLRMKNAMPVHSVGLTLAFLFM